jgi:hypothetical protein
MKAITDRYAAALPPSPEEAKHRQRERRAALERWVAGAWLALEGKRSRRRAAQISRRKRLGNCNCSPATERPRGGRHHCRPPLGGT